MTMHRLLVSLVCSQALQVYPRSMYMARTSKDPQSPQEMLSVTSQALEVPTEECDGVSDGVPSSHGSWKSSFGHRLYVHLGAYHRFLPF
jgi:hypothetical protein